MADAEKGSFEVTAGTFHQWGSWWMWSKRFFDPQKIGMSPWKTSGCVQNWGILPSLSDLTIKYHQQLHCFWVQILGMWTVGRRTWQAFHKHWQSVRHRHLQQEANANWWGIGGEQSKKGVKLGYTNVLICLECTHMFTCFIMFLSYQSLSFKSIFFFKVRVHYWGLQNIWPISSWFYSWERP